MKETILQLHRDMEQAIGQPSGETTASARIEECYRIAADYWQRTKQHIRQTRFPDDAAEIDFFKNLKPTFTGLLEYYLLLFRYNVHAEPGGSVLEQFRMEEINRIRAFRETHAVLINYCDEARTEWDDLYFLRRKYHKVQRPPSQVYDRAKDFWTNGDWIVTQVYAGRLFERFLEAAPPILNPSTSLDPPTQNLSTDRIA
jgi:hypothetical protein